MWRSATHIKSASAGDDTTSAVRRQRNDTHVCRGTHSCFSFAHALLNACHPVALRCPPGKEYQPCVSTCTSRTCLNREYYEETTCSFIREECVCRGGTILHRADSPYCVTEDRCGEWQSNYMPLWWKLHCQGVWKSFGLCFVLLLDTHMQLYHECVCFALMYPVCTDNEGNPRAPGEVWNGSARSCCLYKCMENGTVVAVEPDCSSVPTPLCEREGEYVLDVVEEGACCPKKICGEFKDEVQDFACP